eukprot:8972543-Pyramimonas_sp.AAC.1
MGHGLGEACSSPEALNRTPRGLKGPRRCPKLAQRASCDTLQQLQVQHLRRELERQRTGDQRCPLDGVVKRLDVHEGLA